MNNILSNNAKTDMVAYAITEGVADFVVLG